MCTLEKRGGVFVLTLSGDDEHRLSPTLIDAIQASLRRVRAHARPGLALITTAEGKFFSNGLDLIWAKSAGPGYRDRFNFMISKFKLIVTDLISLPMPTIAAVTGHASAAGFHLALSHDYIYMRKDRGFLYMSELDIDLTFPDYTMALMRSKIGARKSLRDAALRAAKIKAEEAVEMGIIDAAHDSAEETLDAAMRLGVKLAERNWDGDVYASTRKQTFPEVAVVLGLAEKKTATASRL